MLHSRSSYQKMNDPYSETYLKKLDTKPYVVCNSLSLGGHTYPRLTVRQLSAIRAISGVWLYSKLPVRQLMEKNLHFFISSYSKLPVRQLSICIPFVE